MQAFNRGGMKGGYMEVRNYKWDFADAGKMKSAGFEKLLFNAMSLVFPEGERFFVRSVKNFADRAETDQEKQEIKAFIGQEIQHGRAHELFNESIMGKEYDTKTFAKIYKFLAYDIIEPAIERILGKEVNLAVTAASEHFTATWSEAELRSRRFETFDSESLRRLATWHSLEELEHKHVAFDLLKKVNPSYLLRVTGLALSTAQFIGFVGLAFALLLAQEKNVYWRKLAERARQDAASETGFSNLFAQAFIAYLKEDFHPSQRDDAALREAARQYLEASAPAA
jgi:uncharacterized protein